MSFESDAAIRRAGQEDYTANTYLDGGIFLRGQTNDQVCNLVSIDHEQASVTAAAFERGLKDQGMKDYIAVLRS